MNTGKKKSCSKCDDAALTSAPENVALSPTARQGFAAAMAGVGPTYMSPAPAGPESAGATYMSPLQSAMPQTAPHVQASGLAAPPQLPRVSPLHEYSRKEGCVYLYDQVITTPGGSFRVR